MHNKALTVLRGLPFFCTFLLKRQDDTKSNAAGGLLSSRLFGMSMLSHGRLRGTVRALL